ncbi:MAG: DUF1311 domain-containing protein [Sphingomonadales bacterium]|nr:DUF1311 domain-containing protein [Sphingomonadales bacterium]
MIALVTLLLAAAPAAPDPFAYTLAITPVEGPVDNGVEARYTRAHATCKDHAQGTNETAKCFVAEFARQDGALNRQWAKTLARVPAPQRPALRAAQRRWVSQRDPFCDAVYKSFDGGTFAPIAYADCRVELTIRRTMWLEQLAR